MNIMLVEPDPMMASLVEEFLSSQGYSVSLVSSAQDAVDWLDKKNRHCDLIILEPILPNNSGIELIHELRSYEDWIDIPIVIHSRIDFETVFDRNSLKNDYGVNELIKKGSDSLRNLEISINATRKIIR